MRQCIFHVVKFLNRRMPNGTYGGVRGRRLITASYSISYDYLILLFDVRLVEFLNRL